jgi:methylenetetrahydrofolate reductase (NADPH)
MHTVYIYIYTSIYKNRMCGFCKTKVPSEVTEQLEIIKDDEEAVKKFGLEFGVKMCQKLLDFGAPGLHFYTLNQSSTTIKLLNALGFHSKDESKAEQM